jgi:hypothetical protein
VEGFKVEHRPGHALDGSMVLLNKIIQILDLTNLGGYLPTLINPTSIAALFAPLWSIVTFSGSHYGAWPFRRTERPLLDRAWTPKNSESSKILLKEN